jgi:hypothetical protein
MFREPTALDMGISGLWFLKCYFTTIGYTPSLPRNMDESDASFEPIDRLFCSSLSFVYTMLIAKTFDHIALKNVADSQRYQIIDRATQCPIYHVSSAISTLDNPVTRSYMLDAALEVLQEVSRTRKEPKPEQVSSRISAAVLQPASSNSIRL